MIANQCNILATCGVDIPKGTLPPIEYHNPQNFVSETLEVCSSLPILHCSCCIAGTQ